MLERRSDRIQLALIAVMTLAGLWALRQAQPGTRVPIHFDAHGTPNGWADPLFGTLMIPALAVLLLGLRSLLPRIDPLGDNLVRSSAAVSTIFTAVTAVLAVAQGMIVAASVGVLPATVNWMPLSVGALFVVIGNVMGKLRRNYTVGIRTSWTLGSERVWDQTHRFGGKLWVVGGLLLCTQPWLPAANLWQTPAVLAVALVCALAPVLKSYLLWRALPKASAEP